MAKRLSWLSITPPPPLLSLTHLATAAVVTGARPGPAASSRD